MTVKELTEILEDYGDHLEIKVVREGDLYDTAYEIQSAGSYSNDAEFVQIEITANGTRIE